MITKIYVILDDKNKIWSDTARSSQERCVKAFVRDWLSRCEIMDWNDAYNVWKIFEKNGWQIKEMNCIEAKDDN